MRSKKVRINFAFVLILGLLSMMPPLGIDMYLPAFLNISRDLNVPSSQVQYTLTMFTLGMGVGQLVWGPIADSIGRKPVILFGLIITTIAAFGLTQINNIHHFIGLRLIQGFFGAAPVVVLGALLRDLFSKNDFSKMMSLITLVLMIAPLLAPILGGYLVQYFHWHSIFYLLVVVGVISGLLFWWRIPETLQAEKRQHFSLQNVLRQFWSVLKHKEVLGYLIVSTFSFGGLFAFLTSGSLVYIDIYGVKVENFGYFFMLNITIMAAFTVLNGKIVGKVGAERMLQFGLAMQAAAGLWLLIVAVFDLGFWPMALGIAWFIGMNSTIGANAAALILEHFGRIAGTANSVLGTLRFGGGAVIGSILALVPVTSAIPMLATMIVCITIAVLGYWLLTYRNLQK
ncbi:Bcr/CflA family multidrug efflux MFS transporter [Gallibacterium anatis]|uniref:Bcr/CflA family multidrug efflux MFS transporter n=1 Tax=Gallibacterium anatis TaxID=750 RepID=UPI003003AAAC